MVRNTLILFIILFNIFLHLDFGFPCTCVPPDTPTEELEKSDAVFAGTVIELRVDTLRVDNVNVLLFRKAKFEVLAVWKGLDLGDVTVMTPFETSACGFAFEQGTSYLVYAFLVNDSLSTNICTRTKKLSEAEEDLEELGKPLVVGVAEGLETNKNPQSPYLQQNYPNPFNPATKILYFVPKSNYVKLTVYDILGNEIQTLVNEIQTAGTYSVTFDASKLSSGVYFYKLQIGALGQSFVEVKKMLLMR